MHEFVGRGRCLLIMALLGFLLSNIHSGVVEIEAGVLRRGTDDSDFLSVLVNPPLEFAGMCVRLLTLEGEIGCSSSSDGAVGALVEVTNFTSQESVASTLLPIDEYAPLVAVIFERDFCSRNVGLLFNTTIINGVLLILDESGLSLSSGFSPAESNPNGRWFQQEQLRGGATNASSYAWNRPGDGFAFENIPLVVAAISSAEAARLGIVEKARLNLEASTNKWSVQLSSFMHAAGNAQICLNRDLCDPLGGQSVYSVLNGPLTPDSKTIFVTTKLDSYAFFQQLARGADAAVSSTAALLATADLLSQSFGREEMAEWSSRVVFAFFNGESFGYLGSKRFVKDVIDFKCQTPRRNGTKCYTPFKYALHFRNFNIDNVQLLVDVQQVGLSTSFLSLHSSLATESALLSTLVAAGETSDQVLRHQSNQSLPLPPSSSFAFVKATPSLPTAIVTDHEFDFANRFYHSHLDARASQLDVAQICRLSTALARSLYVLANTEITVAEAAQRIGPANCTLIQEILSCLLESPSCDLVRQLVDPDVEDGVPPQMNYVSVFSWTNSISFNSQFVHSFMVNRTGTTKELGGDDCQPSNCAARFGGTCLPHQHCVLSETYFHDALSPAFEYNDDSGLWEIVDASEPTFVESRWNQLSMSLFVRNSFWSRATLLGFGIFQLIICISAFIMWRSRYQTL